MALWVAGCDPSPTAPADRADGPASADRRPPPHTGVTISVDREAVPDDTEVDDTDGNGVATGSSPPAQERDHAETIEQWIARARPASSAVTIEVRRLTRPTMIYGAPNFSAPFRGKLLAQQDVDVIAWVDGEGCRAPGWGQLKGGAFACFDHSSPGQGAPLALPPLIPAAGAPHFYARLSKAPGATVPAPVPRWRSRLALLRGDEPMDYLISDHDYAFIAQRSSPAGKLLVDEQQRVVRVADVRLLEPSAFAGRDLLARPLASNAVLAWSIAWPAATARAAPETSVTSVSQYPLHRELEVTTQTVSQGHDEWVALATTPPSWIDASEIRRWQPLPPPPELQGDDLWIDVDLDQQTLMVAQGDQPLFVTLISSGRPHHGTPLGLFRLRSKWATVEMNSDTDDPDPYVVEAVPWTQYFHQDFALHGTFWHNRFGRRTSHGCVNLSLHDAALVYAMTTPRAYPGWQVAFDHPADPGTLVRVRKGPITGPDRRDP